MYLFWLQISLMIDVLCDSSSRVSTDEATSKENAPEIGHILGAAGHGWNSTEGQPPAYNGSQHGKIQNGSNLTESLHTDGLHGEQLKDSNASVIRHLLIHGLHGKIRECSNAGVKGRKVMGNFRPTRDFFLGTDVGNTTGSGMLNVSHTQRAPTAKTINPKPTDFHDCRLPESLCGSVKKLDQIYAALHKMVEKYSNLTKLSVIGKTYRGNPIYAVEMHSGNAFHYAIVVVDFGMHPREWASSAAALYVMEKLLEEGGKMTENIQWFIIPMLNPDGYMYSTSVNNMWRKNRRPIRGSRCSGIDLNRNFGVGWEASLSVDPCREDYSGREPFSEIESKVVKDFVKMIGPRFVDAYVSVHSCLQSIFYPYEYTEEEPPSDLLKNLKEVGAQMAKAMYEVRNQNYYVGTNSKYFVGGGVIDHFMFAHFQIPLVYRIELGDVAFFKEEDYHRCYHPQEPNLMDNLIKECHAGLRALANYLIETRTPYSYKQTATKSPARQGENEAVHSATCNQRATFELPATLIASQVYRLVS